MMLYKMEKLADGQISVKEHPNGFYRGKPKEAILPLLPPEKDLFFLIHVIPGSKSTGQGWGKHGRDGDLKPRADDTDDKPEKVYSNGLAYVNFFGIKIAFDPEKENGFGFSESYQRDKIPVEDRYDLSLIDHSPEMFPIKEALRDYLTKVAFSTGIKEDKIREIFPTGYVKLYFPLYGQEKDWGEFDVSKKSNMLKISFRGKGDKLVPVEVSWHE